MAAYIIVEVETTDEALMTEYRKHTPEAVAKEGYDVMMKGQDHVVAGWKNKVEAALANVVPDSVLAERRRRAAQAGSAHH